MTPLEQLLAGEQKPSFIFGYGYTGPEKPSDLSTAGYLMMFLGAAGFIVWTLFW